MAEIVPLQQIPAIYRFWICSIAESNLEEDDDRYLRYIPLLKAALRGEWDTAKEIFDQDKIAITAPITASSDTALHIAVRTGERAIHFVEKVVELMLLELMPVRGLKALERCEIYGNTALHIAAWVGNTRAAAVLVQKNPNLLYIRDKDFNLPLHLAARNACKETLLYLLSVTEDDPVSMPFSLISGVRLVNYAISSRLYDVALSLVQRYPEFATSKDDHNDFALGWTAGKASAFRSGSHQNFWQWIIYNCVPVKLEMNSIKYPSRACDANSSPVIVQKQVWSIWAQFLKDFSISVPPIKRIREQKEMHDQALALLRYVCKQLRSLNHSYGYKLCKEAILYASRLGIHEVIEEIVDSFPQLIWTKDDDEHGNYNLFQRAIVDRQEKVFNLIYQMGDHKQYVTILQDDHRNTLLHLAGRLATQKKLDQVPGAALQMQRELQWFKAVEKLVRPGYVEWDNEDAETPAMVFTKEHQKLVVQGQKWMKDTANSCTIAAALIVTIVFAAAITVPGGNNDTGLPMFSKKIAFITFVVSDAISLFTSTTSLLMFLSILTSRCAESDFLYVLPKRLIIGLLTLFLSITTMVVAFSATLYLVFGQDKGWILIPVAVLASLPVTSFVSLQFPLLVDLISSTYGSGIFGKQSDRPFY